jgi:hypothetical protein
MIEGDALRFSSKIRRFKFISRFSGFFFNRRNDSQQIRVADQGLVFTADCDKRVVFWDLLLHLGCDLWFSFCTARDRDRPGTKTEP